MTTASLFILIIYDLNKKECAKSAFSVCGGMREHQLPLRRSARLNGYAFLSYRKIFPIR